MSNINLFQFFLFSALFVVSRSQSSWIHSYNVSIILGNQRTSKAEIYRVTFVCTDNNCSPMPLTERDLVWSSPDTPSISEVKYVSYLGQEAILCTTENGAVVYEYPRGKVLFRKEMDPSFYLNVHSAEVLPDGNVIVAGARSDGIFAILYPDPNNVTQQIDQTVTVNTPFAHALTFDKSRNLIYAGGYLTLLALTYTSGSDGRGSLQVVRNVSIEMHYEEPNKNENGIYEDGIHDLYPVHQNTDKLFLSTGEHVFMLNVQDFSIDRYPTLHSIASQKSDNRAVAVKNKGGVKSVSMDASNGLVIAKASPWFKEYYSDTLDENYSPYAPIILWSTAAQCSQPGYDVGENCKIDFDNLQPIWFYKARLFILPLFSY